MSMMDKVLANASYKEMVESSSKPSATPKESIGGVHSDQSKVEIPTTPDRRTSKQVPSDKDNSDAAQDEDDISSVFSPPSPDYSPKATENTTNSPPGSSSGSAFEYSIKSEVTRQRVHATAP